MKDIVQKIKKCLALSKSPQAEEAAAALRKAQELMQKHGVNMEQVKLSEVGKQPCIRKRKTILQYEAVLVKTIQEVFGVECYFSEDVIVWVGIDPNLQIAQYAYDVLSDKQHMARAAFLKTVSKKFKRHNRIAKADAYATGWAYGVRQAVSTLPKVEVPGVVHLYMDELMKDKAFKNTSARARKGNISEGDKWVGYNDGKQVDIQAGLNHTANKQQQLH